MFKCDYKSLRLCFYEFHDVQAGDMPEYGNYCLLELKDGRHTAGQWYPKNYNDRQSIAGNFGRGTADSVDAEEVAKWHDLNGYDLTRLLEKEDIGRINLRNENSGDYYFEIAGFKSFKDSDFPKKEQFCLLILKNGTLAAGRWNQWRGEKGGQFIYASALASHSMDKVWAWAALSSDEIFEREEKQERERLKEEELNRNPSADPEKFKYGTDINVYYEKALEKLRGEYPWATLAQMKKRQPNYMIVPRHGQYIFGQDNGTIMGIQLFNEWTDGRTADEFIDFLCDYTRETVKNYNPETKFKYGMDISVYLEKAYEKVKKEYRWLNKDMLRKHCQFAIIQVDGEWEFARKFRNDNEFHVFDCSPADRFLECVENEYQEAALRENSVVAEYKVPFGCVEINGWYLERYVIYKLKSGDYKVSVTAGDRVTGGSREFFITPDCFEAKTYEEFLDRYLEIVPGNSFGLDKKDLLPNEELKEFFGYK